MPTLEPALALQTCETALRELMTHAYRAEWGEGWLERITTEAQRETWAERAEIERQRRGTRGVVQIPPVGLAYANFYDLLAFAEKHWGPLAAALGHQKSMMPLLSRFEILRDPVGHSRALLPFEADLLSGIAGQVRNQVTIYMSSQDPAGDIYPRIESITDSLGRRIESSGRAGAILGSVTGPLTIVRPGDVVTFTCVGIDPQGRDLEWVAKSLWREATRGPSGQATLLHWTVVDRDVNESKVIIVRMRAAGTPYHRGGQYDQAAHFHFRVRPPGA